MMYGDISHWMMLKATIKTPSVAKLKMLSRLRTTANMVVDKPIIMAKVPAIESRSFQTFTFMHQLSFTDCRQLICLSQ